MGFFNKFLKKKSANSDAKVSKDSSAKPTMQKPTDSPAGANSGTNAKDAAPKDLDMSSMMQNPLENQPLPEGLPSADQPIPDLPPLPPGLQNNVQASMQSVGKSRADTSDLPQLPDLPKFDNHPELHMDDVPDQIEGIDTPSRNTAQTNDLPDLPPLSKKSANPQMPTFGDLEKGKEKSSFPSMPSLENPPTVSEETPSNPKPSNTFSKIKESARKQTADESYDNQPSEPKPAESKNDSINEFINKLPSKLSATQSPESIPKHTEELETVEKEFVPDAENVYVLPDKPLFVDVDQYQILLQDLAVTKQDLMQIHDTSKDAEHEEELSAVLSKFKDEVIAMKDTVVSVEKTLFAGTKQ